MLFAPFRASGRRLRSWRAWRPTAPGEAWPRFSYTAQHCTSTSYCAMWQCPTYADRAGDWGGQDFATELYKLQPAVMFGTAAAPKWIFHSIISSTASTGPPSP